MATAKKLPSGQWRTLVYYGRDLNGKRIYKSFTAETKKESELLASEFLCGKQQKKENNKTLLECIEEYIASKDNILSPSTIRSYEIQKKHAYNSIKHLKILKIDEDILQEWANKNAIKYSSKSLRNQFGLLVSVFKQQKISLDFSAVTLKKPDNNEIVIPTLDEMAKIREIIKETPIKIPILLALELGLRQSEIAGLQWKDFDGEKIKIYKSLVPNKNNKFVLRTQTKSWKSTRTIDVLEPLKSLLIKEKAKVLNDEEHISKLKPRGISKRFSLLCEKKADYDIFQSMHKDTAMPLLCY